MVLDAWPASDDDLPTTVKTVFDALFALRIPEINVAVQALTDDPASGLTTPGRRLNKSHKCRALAAPQCATEVAKFVDRSDFTIKMAGKAWFRALGIKSDLESSLDSDPDARYRADEILEQVLEVAACADSMCRGDLDLGPRHVCQHAPECRKSGGHP